MEDNLIALLALEQVDGLGNKGIKQLISYCGSAANVLKQPQAKLVKIPGVGEKLAKAIISDSDIRLGEATLNEIGKIKARIITYTQKEFPKRLNQIPDGPNYLIVKGNADLNPKRTVAIVGTRKATTYGKSITEKIVKELSQLDVQVISGLAYGIDIQAHKSSLESSLSTLAILAGGLDRVYPSQHKKYAEEIQNNGAIISESLPGIKPDPHLFPARNRIIAGMSDAVIIVEAAKKGGALITANVADSYDRPVFAVPGNVGNTYSEGTNYLIQSQKALIYTKIEDIIYYLNWDKPEKREIPLPNLNPNEQVIYSHLQINESGITIDELAIQTHIPINQLASDLLSMEFKNLVKSLPGKKYQLA